MTFLAPISPEEKVIAFIAAGNMRVCKTVVFLVFYSLLYLLVSTRVVIGQFSGPYSPVRPAKI